jgi:2-dehydro-3-deoxyphosphooctonate aldolase (KDO 8-P synthase)
MLNFNFNNNAPLRIIAGPCQIESYDHSMMMAETIKNICDDVGIRWVYKSSFDKANRSSISSARGVGIHDGLEILNKIKNEFQVPVLTDIHTEQQANTVADVVDVIQIPAFLCRQTDLIVAAAKTGKWINVKKGQFLSYNEVINIKNKFPENKNFMITERGTTFGYNNLVVDMRGVHAMREHYPVIMDGTHSVQQPGGMGQSSGGDRQFVEPLCKSAVALGIAGVFLEVHNDPDHAPSDGPNMLDPTSFRSTVTKLKEIDTCVKQKL